MGDYAPIYLYADQVTGTASAAITGGQVLVVTGDDSIGPAAADAPNVIGVAAMDGAIGHRVSYFPRGKIHESVTGGAVTAGARVYTASGGLVDDTGSGPNRIGVFLTSAGSGDLARWMEV